MKRRIFLISQLTYLTERDLAHSKQIKDAYQMLANQSMMIEQLVKELQDVRKKLAQSDPNGKAD